MMVEEKRPARTGTLRALRAQVVGTRAGYDVRVGFGDAFFFSFDATRGGFRGPGNIRFAVI